MGSLCCRQLQLKVEQLAGKAFGSRAVLLRALPQSAAQAYTGGSCSFMLAAQVRSSRSALPHLSKQTQACY